MPQLDRQPPDAPPAPSSPNAAAQLRLARDAAPLAALLGALRKRSARLLRARAVLLGLSAAAGILLVSAALLAFKIAGARPMGWLVALIAFVGIAAHGLWRARRASRDDLAAARLLGSISPGEASDLLSAVELCRSEDGSAALGRAHLERMGLLAATLDHRPALRATPVLTALGVLVAALFVHALAFGLGKGRLREAYAFLVFAADESAPLFAPEPIAGDISLTYRYPAHMNRPPRTVAGTSGDISAPKGTVVDFTATADRDVVRAVAVMGPDETSLHVNGRALSGTLLVTAPGEWSLRYLSASGAVKVEGAPRPVAIEPDAFPQVRLTAPEPEIEVDGQEVIELAFEASDDYGLSSVMLVYSLGRGQEEQRKPLSTFAEAPRRHAGSAHWDLRPLSLRPGDRVTYYLEAVDNDSVSGLKKGVSSTQVLKVFSETEHHQAVLKKAQEQWERLVSGLGDRLEEAPADAAAVRPDAEWARTTTEKDRLLASVAGDMRGLARTLADDPRAPPEIGRALAHVSERVSGAVARTSSARAAFVRRPSPPAARQLRTQLGAEIDEEEKGVLYLEDLIDRRRLLDLQQMARELQQGREELTRLVERHRDAPDDATKRELMAELSRLKERMHELFRRMKELSGSIQDEHLNEEAAQTMDEGQNLLSRLDEIQKQLAQGESDAALKALEELQKELEQMEKRFGEQAGETDEEQKQIGRELQQLASNLLDVEAEQRAVKAATDAARQKAKSEQQERLKKLGQEFVQKQRDRLAQGFRELEGVDPQVLERFGEDETLQYALDRLTQADKALEAGDFDEALEQAIGAAQRTRELRMRMGMEVEQMRRFPVLGREPAGLEDGARRAESAERPVREVREDLEKLMREQQKEPTEQERREMQELARKQGALQRQTEQLQQKLDELGQKMPLFGPGEQQLLKDAAEKMGHAQGRLVEGDARGAGSRQQDALEKLQALKDAMKDSQQGQGQGGGVPMPFASAGEGEGEGRDGRGFRPERVEIPAADQNRAPEEFRRDILDAMKDAAPDRYKERVREYYEELVK